ncbi:MULTISPECIES: hypothetical protein [Paenibacillus]|uniref:hypothetical protein n=1 Tax=Paenibacillus TaxID=44249 RepID=UPI00020D76A1|nr:MULTISPECIES: hypothetical protein [Paenibacillus]EGL19886.1 hypothetical protein HMPREF9413_3300 [Paenibacillus sp. HGF7]EPD88605.1 hypothetical protein HMPREF1207_02034 [Paenibacillus sp. HGH0039]MBV6716697.1 hypothetical protein [Paenibacillus chitinolyticus]
MTPHLTRIVKRKLLSAAISSFLFAFFFAWYTRHEPFFYHPSAGTVPGAFSRFMSVGFIYLAYSAPVIYVYGTFTSLLSDFIGFCILPYSKLRLVISGIMHGVFGLILCPASLAAAALFFVADITLAARFPGQKK